MNEQLHPTLYADINAVLHHFLVNIQALLGRRFLGMYVLGSLALGDFDPHTSDIDFLVVTDVEMGDDLFHGLQELHAHFALSSSPWAAKVEAVYVPQAAFAKIIDHSATAPQHSHGRGAPDSYLQQAQHQLPH